MTELRFKVTMFSDMPNKHAILYIKDNDDNNPVLAPVEPLQHYDVITVTDNNIVETIFTDCNIESKNSGGLIDGNFKVHELRITYGDKVT